MSPEAGQIDAPATTTEAPHPFDEWQLTVALADGTAKARGGQFAQRRDRSVFVGGLLFDRDDLARKGSVSARGLSDAELLLAAFERVGEAILPTLRGCFVVALTDRARNRTVVARDPLGAHPLFYAQTGSAAFFATQPQTVLACPGVSRALNSLAIADHLCNRWPDSHETFFAAVQAVPPGWSIEIAQGRSRRARYWEPVGDGAIDWLSEQEANRFEEVLDRAVQRCLTLGQTGIFLSGGIDSVSIAASAVDQQRQTGGSLPLALSLAFPDPKCDERVVQRNVAEHLGLRMEMIPFWDAVGPRGLIAGGLDVSATLPFPLFNTWAPAYLELARRGRDKGVEVIVTGVGGDEWLGVSPFLIADMLLSGDISGLARFTKQWHTSYDTPWVKVLRRGLWTYGVRPIGSQVLHRTLPKAWTQSRARRAVNRDPAWVAPSAGLRKQQADRAAASLVDANPKGGFYARDCRSSLDHPLISREIEEQWEFGRRLGLTFMHPYWDPDLTAHIYRTPPEILLRGGRAKSLVREMLSKRFPDLGFDRHSKVSALAFFQSILASEGPSVAKEIGDFRALQELGVIDNQGARAYVDSALQDAATDRTAIRCCHLFAIETWTRTQLQLA